MRLLGGTVREPISDDEHVTNVPTCFLILPDVHGCFHLAPCRKGGKALLRHGLRVPVVVGVLRLFPGPLNNIPSENCHRFTSQMVQQLESCSSGPGDLGTAYRSEGPTLRKQGWR